MAEELGRIERPDVEDFKKGRKLYFIPLVFYSEETSVEYLDKYNRYWEQVEKQIEDLELKLGAVNRIYHEMVPVGGEDGVKAVKDLNERSHKLIEACIVKGAQLEALEEPGILTEFMDWNRCLLIGLQNQNVFTKVYDLYLEANKKRNEYISQKLQESLLEDEIGILIMRENHQVQFPQDIQVIYVAPPALNDIKRWVRDNQPNPEASS